MKAIQDKLIFIILALVLIVPLSKSFFIVEEGETAILLRFKKIVGEQDGNGDMIANTYKPGMHLMIPFIDTPVIIDAKLQTIISDENIRTHVRSPIDKEMTQKMVKSLRLFHSTLQTQKDYMTDQQRAHFDQIDPLYQIFKERTDIYSYTDRDEYLQTISVSDEDEVRFSEDLKLSKDNISMFFISKALFIEYLAIYNSNDTVKQNIIAYLENSSTTETDAFIDDINSDNPVLLYQFDNTSSETESTTKLLNTNYYIKYRLNQTDPRCIAQFYTWTKTGLFSDAEENIRKHVTSEMQAILSNTNITMVIQGGIRDTIANKLKAQLNDEYKNDKKWGVEIIDIRLKKIDYPEGSKGAVYERMRSEQETQSQKITAQGQAEKDKLIADGDKQAEALLQAAKVEARETEAHAQRDATMTYQSIYGKGADDAKKRQIFESLYKLEALSSTITESDTLVISDDNALFSPLAT